MKNRNQNSILAFIGISLICLINQALNAQELATEERDVKEFTSLIVTSGIDVVLSQGTQQKVIVTGPQENIDEIITTVDDKTLTVEIKPTASRITDIEVLITITDIEMIKASEGSDVETEGKIKLKSLKAVANEGSDLELNIHADNMVCEAKEGSDIELEGVFAELSLTAKEGSDIEAEIEASKLSLHVKEGSDIEIEGKSNDVNITIKEGSDVEADKLIAENCTITASEGVDVDVNVTGSINVTASQGTDITVAGDPKNKTVNAGDDCDVRFK